MSMRSQLPPLDLLVAFEAAARMLSFTAAANELNLSQAAISQQIRQLEDRLGVKLFDRAHRAVSLTSAGREYQHTVAALLNTLASATSEIQYAETRPKLTVAADRAAANFLLMPHVDDFAKRYPDISLRIISSDNLTECLAPDVDVAIVHGDGNWPGFTSRLLFREQVYPVCSPAYLENAPSLRSTEDLAAHTLLNLGDDHWNWMNWRVWLSGNDVGLPAKVRIFEINSYPLLIEATRKGMGLALGWHRLLDADLSSGRLVRPLDARLRNDLGYYLVFREQPSPEAVTTSFCAWFLEFALNQTRKP